MYVKHRQRVVLIFSISSKEEVIQTSPIKTIRVVYGIKKLIKAPAMAHLTEYPGFKMNSEIILNTVFFLRKPIINSEHKSLYVRNMQEGSDESSFDEIPCNTTGCNSTVIVHESGWACEGCGLWFCEGCTSHSGRYCKHAEVWYCISCINTTNTLRCNRCRRNMGLQPLSAKARYFQSERIPK